MPDVQFPIEMSRSPRTAPIVVPRPAPAPDPWPYRFNMPSFKAVRTTSKSLSGPGSVNPSIE